MSFTERFIRNFYYFQSHNTKYSDQSYQQMIRNICSRYTALVPSLVQTSKLSFGSATSEKENQTKNWSDRIKLGEMELKNRICLSSLTRQRCDPKNGIPNDLMATYYEQRSGAALVFTEASAWAQRGEAFPGAGNFYTKEQVQGWRKVVEKVHGKGSKMIAQLFHAGRATDPKLNGGLEPIAPSAVAIRSKNPGTQAPYPTPRQITADEIQQTIKDFSKSVELAKSVGFDGVEIHGANGYIVDQFLKSISNKRTDRYGGSVQNRTRFCLQLIDAATKIYKPYQVGVKLSPVSQYNDMWDDTPLETFTHLVKQLSKRQVGFIQIRESTEVTYYKNPNFKVTPPEQIQHVCKALRPHFNGIIIANDCFGPDNGIEVIRKGWADMVSFGRNYIGNPDLAERILKKQQLNTKLSFPTFYGFHNGAKGYTDYPFYEEWKKAQEKK